MRQCNPNDETIRGARVRDNKNPSRHSRSGSARHSSLLLLVLIAACTPRPVEAFSLYNLWIIILSAICQLPIITWFDFCSKVGCTGDVNSDICQVPAEYCAKPPSCTEPLGICATRPTSCPLNYDPVCGCNYETYDNDCNRQAAGVNKRNNGPCGKVCSFGTSTTACNASTEFCDLVLTSCNATIENATAIGECVLVGDACPAVYAPVCGCNGQTYENDCLRIRARVYKARNGLCPGENCTTVDGCFNDTVYCDRLVGNCSSTVGQCVSVPQACDDVLVAQPVCGCDNMTYANDCDRKMERVSLQREGFC